MTVKTLRPYQSETIEKVYATFEEGFRRVAIVLPCGGGKTFTGGHIIRDAIAMGLRVLWLAHRTELIDQAAAAFRELGLDVGVLQGAQRDVYRDVVVASVATAVRDGGLGLLRAARIGLVIVDECHHISAKSYQTLLSELGALSDNGPRLLGVTATLDRADGLRLGDTFQTVAHVVTPEPLIADGFLLRPRGIRVRVEGLDLSTVKRSRTSESGFDDRAMAAAMHDSLAPAAIARAVLEHGTGRCGVAFMPSVELSKEQAQVFQEHGITAVHVDADTPKAVRAEIVRRARLGEYQMVCNVGLFTEGTDIPIWSMVVMGRKTSSPVLFQQMAWRGGRAYGEQRDFVVLDPVGVTGRHKLQTLNNLEGVEIPEDMPDELAVFDEDISESVSDDVDDACTAAAAQAGADGELEHEMFDLFGRSSAAWRRSPGGRWYLRAGERTAVTLETIDDASFDVWHGQECIAEGLTLTDAMREGESVPGADVRGDGWRSAPLTGRALMDAFFRGGASAAGSAGAYEDLRSADWAAKHVDA